MIDPMGLASSGGPYHPLKGVSFKCRNSDTCPEIKGKMWIIMRMINSHQGWDWNNPSPRGGGRHSGEIAELWRAYAKCQALHKKKCENNCPPDKGEPVDIPEPDPENMATGFATVLSAILAYMAASIAF